MATLLNPPPVFHTLPYSVNSTLVFMLVSGTDMDPRLSLEIYHFHYSVHSANKNTHNHQ